MYLPMKRYSDVFMLILLFGVASTGTAAPLANSSNSPFYYKIGSGRSISLPPNANVKTLKVRAAAEFGLGYSCGKFDPTLGLSNILNGLANTGNDLINGAIGAVTAAIGALPALIMQRIDPGLYDLYQNGLIRAEAILALANKTCEQYEQQIRNGENPYEEWTELSKAIDWKVQMGTGSYGSSETDVVQAKKEVETNNGKNGTPWIGGTRAGGENQEPIKTTADVVRAGYNITLNRQPDDTSAPAAGADQQPRLTQIWKKPEEAEQWVVDVVGDVHVRTYDNSPTETVPGHGLLPKIAQKTEENELALIDLVSGTTQPTIENLETVSSDAALINRDVIEAIQGLGPSEQTIAISKLASESAMSNTLEKALTARRLLITGSKEPNVKASPAEDQIEKTVAQLEREIDDVMFERRIHKELASETARIILQLQAAQKSRAGQTQQEAGFDEKSIEEGAIAP
jgi:integrating conjugative element protein (TIGR03755 family)